MALYNPYKEFDLENPILVNLEDSITLYGGLDLDVGLMCTEPRFLGRFRRVLYTGSIASETRTTPFTVTKDHKLVIDNKYPYDVRIINPLGVAYSFASNQGNTCEEIKFDGYDLSCFSLDKFTVFSTEDLNEFLDTFREEVEYNEDLESMLTAYNASNYSFYSEDEPLQEVLS